MNSINKARAAVFVNVFCFVYGLVLLISKFQYLQDEQLTHSQILDMLLTDIHYFLSWNIIIYLIYGLSLLHLTVTLFFAAKRKTPQTATGFLVMGSIWSGYMLFSGGLAVELINSVAVLYQNNRELAVKIWITGSLIHESVGGGNELIGAIWVGLISYMVPHQKGISTATKRFGYVTTFSGLCTLFESYEIFSSLFGVALILWFLLLYIVLPTSFQTWKGRESCTRARE